MAVVLFFAFVIAFVFLASAQEKPKDQEEASPSEVVKQWIAAAAKRDLKVLANLASKTTPKQSLKIIQEQDFLNYQGETKIIHEEIGGDRAVVVYRLENRDAVFTAEIRYDMTLLLREGKQWKVKGREGGVLKPGKQPEW